MARASSPRAGPWSRSALRSQGARSPSPASIRSARPRWPCMRAALRRRVVHARAPRRRGAFRRRPRARCPPPSPPTPPARPPAGTPARRPRRRAPALPDGPHRGPLALPERRRGDAASATTAPSRSPRARQRRRRAPRPPAPRRAAARHRRPRCSPARATSLRRASANVRGRLVLATDGAPPARAGGGDPVTDAVNAIATARAQGVNTYVIGIRMPGETELRRKASTTLAVAGGHLPGAVRHYAIHDPGALARAFADVPAPSPSVIRFCVDRRARRGPGHAPRGQRHHPARPHARRDGWGVERPARGQGDLYGPACTGLSGPHARPRRRRHLHGPVAIPRARRTMPA